MYETFKCELKNYSFFYMTLINYAVVAVTQNFILTIHSALCI